MIKKLKDELVTVKSMDGLTLEKNQGQQFIEDDMILSNADHMLWLSKELAACKNDTSRAQNPFVVGKLDIESV